MTPVKVVAGRLGRTRLLTMRETALSHKAADEACGRTWQCACAACRSVRKAKAEGR